MNQDKLSSYISLLANIGVLAGILFLAFEISQNTNMMRSQTRDSVTAKQADYLFTIGGNLETAAIVRKGNSGALGADSELTLDEQAAYFNLHHGILRIWENEYYQYQSGLFEMVEFQPRVTAWQSRIRSSSGLKEVWARVRQSFSPEFSELIDGLIE